jgi:O-antigen biosynthesis protein
MLRLHKGRDETSRNADRALLGGTSHFAHHMTLQLDLPILFAEPRRLTPHSRWHQHIPFAMWFTALARPHLLVELGTYYGDSYCAFCQAVETLGLDTRCFAVDSWSGDPHSGEVTDEVIEDLRAHHDPLYGAFSLLLRSTFDDAVQSFEDGSIDVLHIDGCHTYEAVYHDFQTWLPKTSQQGIVLFHGISVRDRNFGVWRLWDEIRHTYPTIELTQGYGLGVAAVGSCPPEGTLPLFQASANEQAHLRRVTQALGNRLSIAVERASLEHTVVYHNECLSALQAETERLRNELRSTLRRFEVEREKLMERAQQQLEDVVQRLKHEREEVMQRNRTDRQSLQQRLEANLAEVTGQLERVRHEVDDLRGALDSQKATLDKIHASKVFRYTYGLRLLYAKYLEMRDRDGGGPRRVGATATERHQPIARKAWARLPLTDRARLRASMQHVSSLPEQPTALPGMPSESASESCLEVDELSDGWSGSPSVPSDEPKGRRPFGRPSPR